MEIEERIKALKDDFQQTNNEIKQLMLEIRTLLMEAGSPLRSLPAKGKAPGQNNGGN